MAKTDGNSAGNSGNQRPQVQSAAATGKTAVTAAESNRGDTAAKRNSGPTELPPQFGPYRVIKKLGGGGMGTVYLVENTELQREEALKVPHFGDGDNAEARERFLREARAAAQLDHANLCPVYAVGVHDGIYYMTMRLLKGKLLSDYSGKAQPARKAIEIVARLAQALEAAHAKGVIHRDLKPSNVMIVSGVGPVVMDFGLAKQVKKENQKLTQSGSILGTPSYMPPEQVNGNLEQMGPASDVYSLGVILYECLTGRLPFEAPIPAVFGQILFTEAPLPSSLQPGLNPALDAICMTAMAKVVTNRYPSMKAFAAALIDYLRSAPATEGVGNLTPATVDKASIFQTPTVAPGPLPAGQANIFQAQTVAPGQLPTQRGTKAPSMMRRPDGSRQTIPGAGRADDDEDRNSRGASFGSILLRLVLTVLVLGGLGGVGWLAFTVTQKKSPSSEPVAVLTPPTSAKEVATAPADTKPVEPKPADTKPIDTKPVEPKPADTKPPEPKPVEPKPADTKPPEPKPVEPKPADSKPPEPKPADDSNVLLNEDFKNVEPGGRPKGWEGDEFSVLKEDGRRCLTVNSPKGLHYVTLPRLAIKGDFVLECELRLGGRYNTDQLGIARTESDHEFHLVMESKAGAPLEVTVNHLAAVKLGGSQELKTEGFKPFTNIQFRLTRKGDVYAVYINGNVTTGKTLPGKATFGEVRLGLTGGIPTGYNRDGKFLARIHSVKVTLLSPLVPAADPKPADDPNVLVKEDFKNVEPGGRPKGWEGDAFSVLKEEGRGCLTVNNPKGLHYVTLPRSAIKGDFAFECEMRLGGTYNTDQIARHESDHEFHLVLVSKKGAPLEITVNHLAEVKLGAAQEMKAEGFKPFTNIHFRLTRKGDVYAVYINGNVVTGKTIPGTITFEEVRLGLTGGVPNGYNKEGKFVARIHSVKLTVLDPVEPKPADPKPADDPSVLLKEDFKNVEPGGRPKGWKGDAFSVLKEVDRGCLKVNNPKGIHLITLPRLAIKGDFVLECAMRLGGRYNTDKLTTNDADHVFLLFLGNKTGAPLEIAVNHFAAVKLGTAAPVKTEGFKPFSDIQFRLTRKGNVYTVEINGSATTKRTIAGKGTFEEVRLGLTGGMPNGIREGRFLARIYSVKVTLLDPKAAE